MPTVRRRVPAGGCSCVRAGQPRDRPARRRGRHDRPAPGDQRDVQAFVRETIPIRGVQNVLDDVQAGKPQTILVLGSDKRFNEKAGPGAARSDTMMLIRLDPEKNATAVMSIPRDLKATIPGHGVDKINAAYSIGGPKLAVTTVRSLLNIPINHVVNVNFGGFSRAVKRLGCFYIDVDRRYFNDNNPPAGGGGERYATIDIEPGYQRLCGLDSLDYVRFRHLDDDFVRAARQQSYLEQAKSQVGRRAAVLRPRGAPADLRPLHADGHQLRGRDPAPAAADLRGHEVADPRGPLPGRDRERHRRLVRDDHRRQPAEDRPPVPRGARVLRRRSAQADDDDAEDLGRRLVELQEEVSRRDRAPRPRSRRASWRPRREGEDFVATMSTKAGGCRSTTPPSAPTPATPTSPPTRGSTRSGTARATRTRRTGSSATRARTASTGACRARAGARRRSSTTRAARSRCAAASYELTTTARGCGSSPGGRRGASTGCPTRSSRTLTNKQMRDIAKSLTRVGDVGTRLTSPAS